MPAYLRIMLSASATVLILAGCATTSGKAPAPTAQNADCVSASRIPSTSPNCPTPGHAYSADQISTTGATTVGGALQLLDPSLTVHR